MTTALAVLVDRPHVLYRMYGENRRLLYVGITMDVEGRFRAHRDGKAWWPDVRTIELEHHATRDQALRAERDAIRTERPTHNVAHRAGPLAVAGELPDLKEIGEQIARAKAHFEAVKAEAKVAARSAAEQGVSEVQIHRDLGVDRMTVRSWLGKQSKRVGQSG